MSSLSHTKWNCKYHIVFTPKYRRKIFYGQKRMEIGKILRDLCDCNEVKIIEAEIRDACVGTAWYNILMFYLYIHFYYFLLLCSHDYYFHNLSEHSFLPVALLQITYTLYFTLSFDYFLISKRLLPILVIPFYYAS